MQQTNPVPLQMQNERIDRNISGLAANPMHDLSDSQMGTRVRTVYSNDAQIVRPPGFQTGFDQEVARLINDIWVDLYDLFEIEVNPNQPTYISKWIEIVTSNKC